MSEPNYQKVYLSKINDESSFPKNSITLDKAVSKVKHKNLNGLAITVWTFLGIVILLHLGSVIFFAVSFTFQQEAEPEKLKLVVSLVTNAANSVYFFLVTIVTAITTYYYLEQSKN